MTYPCLGVEAGGWREEYFLLTSLKWFPNTDTEQQRKFITASLLASPQPLVLIMYGFRMVKESCEWKTKSNQNKTLKSKVGSKKSLLPSKSGKFTSHCHPWGFHARHIQMGTKTFEWKIQPSSFLSLPPLATRTGMQKETSLAS